MTVNFNDEVMGKEGGGGGKALAKVWFGVENGTVQKRWIVVTRIAVRWRWMV